MEAQITSNDLERLRGRNGLAFLDCDIPPLELLDLINSAFTDSGILLDNSWLKEVLSFQHDGKTDLLLPFGDAKVHPTKIVMWRVLSYQDCRGVTSKEDYTDLIWRQIAPRTLTNRGSIRT